MPRALWRFAHLLLILSATSAFAAAQPTTAEGLRFFEMRVRPLLAERCWDCHSEDEAESELRLDTRSGILRGGTRGPAIVVGKPEDSLLVRALRHSERLQMPPKEKLRSRDIADIIQWIQLGAPWPDEIDTDATPTNTTGTTAQPRTEQSEGQFTDEEKNFWAFQPPVAAPIPQVERQDWVTSPIDAFILDQLATQKLEPASPADKTTLIRRATFDLTGLPPTPAEVDAFLADTSATAFAKVVERLLNSPHYGERWGRHWLDVARYADSNGLDENLAYANAFRYRDYVVAAFNKDKPYDRFVQEQLAGDLLGNGQQDEAAVEAMVATGFLSLGAKMLAEDDPVKMQMDIIDEQIDTVGRTFMGLTLGCARCHDHKFDPIPTADYYSLAGIFKSTRTMENFNVVARWQEQELALPVVMERQREHQQRVAENQARIDRLIERAQQTVLADAKKHVGELESHYPADSLVELGRLRDEKQTLEKSAPVLPEAMVVSDEAEPHNVRIHIRGSHLTQGDEVPRRFPRILAGDEQVPIGDDRSGRLELARWLTTGHHPLTARVMVNRIWQWHFGAGLVRSPDNFGRLGEQPTHPRLLDWLAVQFVESGWSVKSMHRLMMLSSTYQMSSSNADPRAANVDPENRWYARMNRQRLQAEAIRDSILALSGQLDDGMGGTQLPTANRKYVTSTANVNPQIYRSFRRSVYLPIVRSALYEVLQAFDFPDPSVPNGQRQSTTVAPQALFMMNSQFVADQAKAFARSLLADVDADDKARVEKAYRLAYGRQPTPDELDSAVMYISDYASLLQSHEVAEVDRQQRSWQSLCRAIISANEFIFLE